MYRLSSLTQALFLFAVILAVSCTSPNTPSAHVPALTIAIGDHVSARTLVPNLDMTPANYTIAGTGPGGATFQASSTGGTVTQDSLAFGSWTIVAQALNAGGTLIGGGSTTALVHSGETATANVTVTPLTGTGELDLTVNWTASQVQTPGIVASLTPALGSAVNLPFSVSGASATSTNPNLPNGYSTLSVSLQDNGIAVMGAVEIVRIVKDQTTTGTYNFLNVNQATGSIQMNVTKEMEDPLDVVIGGGSPFLVQGTSEALTASVANDPGNTVYVWYVNGVSVATGASYSFGANQKVGNYRIDVTAFTADGSRAGSATTEVRVMETIPLYGVGSTGPAGGLVFYDKGFYSNGWRYMEAAPQDQSSGAVWWNGGYAFVDNALDPAVGAGKGDTQAILSVQGDGDYAATLCLDLTLGEFHDWFLPSLDELNLVYANLASQGLGNFSAGFYWSSTNWARINYAYGENFGDPNYGPNGQQSVSGTNTECFVRAVREF